MNLTTNPFDMVGKEDWELPSSHPYWANYVKVTLCVETLAKINNIDICSKDSFSKKIIFGKFAELNLIKAEALKQLEKCYGAQNKIGEPLTYPCGSPII